jgi:hypothetical protein
MIQIFGTAQNRLDEAGAEFQEAFRRHHPDHGGMVGFPSLGRMSILHDRSYILRRALGTLWDRHSSFECSSEAAEAVVRELAEFVDRTTVRFCFQAQLLNYRMASERIPLPEGLTIRQLSEREVSDIHGGAVWQLGLGLSPRRGFTLHEYAIEGEYEEPKLLGDQQADPSLAYNHVRPQLDNAILALRTFKEGRVGYDYIHFKPLNFCPLPLPSLGYGDLYVPVGQYEISNEEIEPLRQHTSMIFASRESAMEMACSRLSDAQTRLRPQDRLVDAVIGLEALLLAGLRNEDRRGELKYRFSLHYSTLFGTPEERHHAFRVAKDLYDLRSTIAHGGVPKEGGCRVGGEKLKLEDAALRATEVLRGVIRRFLPHAAAAPYKQPQFWDRAYFGLPVEREA